MSSSSRRFEDLKDEVISLKEKIRIHRRRNANELTINKLFIDGDRLIEMIRNEVTKCPPQVQSEMNGRFYALMNEWNAFKKTTLTNPRSTVTNVFGQGSNISDGTQRQILAQGIESLEQTSRSLQRAEMVARETEEIGTNIVDELGNQRESLLRTRQTLDTNRENLKRSHRLLRTINTTLITNKCLLIVIILMEIAILLSIITYRFILPHKK
ncbi:vesicle transport through interaction with t-SNAREs homolog 1A-like [Dermatophagoides pteronyssinus]|uniref:vesicle transport through interaction with t-SNAREs homolog 1A-like n=1 Tax=Dermatophagoides pteronyssinus TaxID=6956 RepID=UPI003F67BD77